ncbi:MAG: tRNA (N6-isopentenyl adenosine(37)-C2)-methylthiotransferase MiaB [Gammaproteobacteria bacterium]|nr:tRNA (N6-isopentenyl adenosine(37)-C2)-methylthiotransferase MiaB [Gammaproteobacteria bacterium]
MNNRLFVATHGCQMNEYDSEKIAEVLGESLGAELVDAPDQAGILLLNTCSVREKAQEKVFSQLGRWKAFKTEHPETIIGVGGCVASQEGEAILRRAPYVDVVFGPQTLHRLPAMITEVRSGNPGVVDVSFPAIEKFDELPLPRASSCTAFVSIMEGCSKYCTFCVVPYTRGEEVSRPLDDVIAEVAALADQGVKEVTLLGQNVNAYRGAVHDGGTADFATLLHYVAAIDGIERLRYTTSHPVEFSDALIEAHGDIPKLGNYLHLPVQSGSDRVLALMKRGHTVAEYLAKIEKLRAVNPDLSISSDFIVGYPGEEDADFEATLALIRTVGFDQSFSFIYSARPGTPAAALDDPTPREIKQRRLAELQSLIDSQARAISEAMVGKIEPVLVERRSKKSSAELSGRTQNNRWVNFPGDARLIGQIVDVHIAAALPHSLRGRLAEPQEQSVA